MKTLIRRTIAPCALLSLLCACGPDPSDIAGTSPPTVATAPTTTTTTPPDVRLTGVVVDIKAIDNNFRPKQSTAKVGDTVRFTNGGRNDHDIRPAEGTDWGVADTGFTPGDVYEHVFTKPGTYAYYCSIHGTSKKGMIGVITVDA